MYRTQISLDPEQHRRLGEEARRLGISASALIRRLVTEYLATPDPDDEDPLAAITGIAHGGGEPIGREHNRFLYGDRAR